MHPVTRLMRKLLVAWFPGLLALLALAGAQAQEGESRAGLVVQYGDGRVETACVRFAEEALSGVELLERAGLPVVTQAGGVGAAVCKIGPDGCDYPAEGCFCERDGARSIYWAFYTLDGGAWGYANVGAANTLARDGDVHGWAWGLGESGSGATPPVVDLAAICGPAPAEPPATAAPATAAAIAPTQAPAAEAAPAPTSAPAPAEAPASGGAPWGYLGFGALVLILGAGAAILARRR